MSNVIDMPGSGAFGDAQRLPEDTGRRVVLLARLAAALGVAAGVGGYLADANRFAFSYLVGFVFTATIAAGALFFVMLQHLTKAGWSVAARRQMEWIAGAIPILLVLFVPVILLASHTHVAWWAGGEALHDEGLVKKEAWLNPTGFIARGFVYIVAWSLLGWYFARTSERQDQSGDVGLTLRLQKLSAPMMLIFALSITFAGFDWLMSLQPHWYSTIFGVYTFAGAFVSSLAVLALITLGLHKGGFYKRVSTVEHRHDIGKLVFAFIVFWAYIAFAQFMLIWYANLPEETIFFRARWFPGSWATVSLLLVVTHFVFPFLFLMSRHPKRHMVGLAVGATVVIFAHYVDMYWLVMPILDPATPNPSWIDLAGLLAPATVLAAVVAQRAQRMNLYPLKDPRLAETVQVENL
jgi:hypothetical protein